MKIYADTYGRCEDCSNPTLVRRGSYSSNKKTEWYIPTEDLAAVYRSYVRASLKKGRAQCIQCQSVPQRCIWADTKGPLCSKCAKEMFRKRKGATVYLLRNSKKMTKALKKILGYVDDLPSTKVTLSSKEMDKIEIL